MDISNLNFINNVSHIKDKQIIAKISQKEINNLSLYIYQKFGKRIIYLGDNNYLLEKTIFNNKIYETLREKFNNSNEFINFINYELYEKTTNYDYKLIENILKPHYMNNLDWELGKACYYGEYCNYMRLYLNKYHKNKLYKKENIRYFKTIMIGFSCDKCGKCSHKYDKENELIKFIPFITNRNPKQLNDSNDDNNKYYDLDRYIFYIQEKNKNDFCESCFMKLPWYLPKAEKKLLLCKILRNYNIPDDLSLCCNNYLHKFD